MTAPVSPSQPMDKPVRQDDPRCDCGHLFEICNSPNCPKGDEYAVLANEERNRFTSRMMSNLDGGKDSEIASLRARVEDLTKALRFYRDEWNTNGDGDSETPGLSRTWMEPTDELIMDEGRKARAALNTGEGE